MATEGLRRSLAYLNWIANPFHGLDTAGVYELLGRTSSTQQGLYINLGYWRRAETIEEASEALAMLVAETGGMAPGDEVLDCGFGFGDQDMLWADRARPDRIVGLNITKSQVHHARERVDEAGLAGRVDLRHGSATNMPIDAECFDLVVALESAFHFVTREDFFAEAFRVLRPGGRLVTADIVPLPPADGMRTRFRQWLSWRLVSGKFVIPDANAYDAEGYARRLDNAGFTRIGIESIRDDVYAPLHDFFRNRQERIEQLHPVARVPARMMLSRSAESAYAGLDYIIASAEKPGAA